MCSSDLTEVSSAGYVYDGQGQRVQKIICPAGTRPCTAASSGAVAITYVYDGFGALAAEYGSTSGTVVLANLEVADKLGVAFLPSIPFFASVGGAGVGILGFLSPANGASA